MSRTHIDHRDLVRFAEDKVNLPKDKADEYRAQARRLREKLEGYLSEHPDFSLKRIQLSGSLAKGTALRSLIVHTMPRHWVYLKMGLPDAYC